MLESATVSPKGGARIIGYILVMNDSVIILHFWVDYNVFAFSRE